MVDSIITFPYHINYVYALHKYSLPTVNTAFYFFNTKNSDFLTDFYTFWKPDFWWMGILEVTLQVLREGEVRGERIAKATWIFDMLKKNG